MPLHSPRGFPVVGLENLIRKSPGANLRMRRLGTDNRIGSRRRVFSFRAQTDSSRVQFLLVTGGVGAAGQGGTEGSCQAGATFCWLLQEVYTEEKPPSIEV